MYGLTSHDVRAVAFQMAKRLNLQNKFYVEAELAGKDWFSFKKIQ